MNETGVKCTDIYEIHDFPGKYKSSVWKDFGFYKADSGELDKSSAVCKICLAQVKYCGNTTNLHTHLAKHRPKPARENQSYIYDEVIITNVEHDGIHQKEQSFTMPVTLSTSSNTDKSARPVHYPAVQTLLMNSNRVQDLNVALARYLISEMRPYDTLENPAFVNLLQTADPGYEIPKSRYFSSSLFPRLYDETRSKMKGHVQSAESVTLSTEIWSSISGEDFVTLNVHLIDDAWQSHMFNLCTEPLKDTGDMGSQLSDVFRRSHGNWQLPPEPVILSSNDSRINNASAILGWKNLACLGTTIDTTASLALASDFAGAIVSQAKDLLRIFNDCQDHKLYVQSGNTQFMDRSDHWFFTFEMLQCFVDNYHPIKNVLESSKLTPETFENIYALLETIKPLKTAAKLLDKNMAAASMILPIMKKLDIFLTCKTENQPKWLTELKTTMWQNVIKPYQDENMRRCLLLCSLLDPRYKDLLFVDHEERQQGKDALADEATILYRSSKTNFDIGTSFSLNATHTGNGISNEESGESCSKRARMSADEDNWLADVVCISTPGKIKRSVEEAVLAEIDHYLSAVQTANQPLDWWKNRQSIYPTLSRLAKKYLCLKATTEQYVRTWSSDVQDHIWSQHRSLLERDAANNMIFLNQNYFKMQ